MSENLERLLEALAEDGESRESVLEQMHGTNSDRTAMWNACAALLASERAKVVALTTEREGLAGEVALNFTEVEALNAEAARLTAQVAVLREALGELAHCYGAQGGLGGGFDGRDARDRRRNKAHAAASEALAAPSPAAERMLAVVRAVDEWAATRRQFNALTAEVSARAGKPDLGYSKWTKDEREKHSGFLLKMLGQLNDIEAAAYERGGR